MVGPTWMRVRLTLGSDCLPVLVQGTVLLLSHTLCHLCSLLMRVQCLMIQGCISTLPPLFPVRVCAPGGYTS